MKVTVMIPTLNEELSIADTILDVMKYAPDSRIVVVDGCSTDRTVGIARDYDAEIIMVKERGKGNAISRAIPQLGETDIVVMMDGDYTYPAQHIPEAVRALEQGYDVVIGYRKWKDPDAMSNMNTFGNKCLSLLASCLYCCNVKDVCTGFWVFRANVLKDMHLISPRFTLEAELLGAAMKGHREVKQIPIRYRARPSRSQTKLRIADGFEIAMFLLGDRMRRQRNV